MRTIPEYIDTVRKMAAGVEPWPTDVADREKRIARQMMMRHDHDMPLHHIKDKKERQLIWENCAACVLARGDRDSNDPMHRPNYAGWLRAYIQAGEAVPQTWLEAELTDVKDRNPAYYIAVLRDVATYGIHRAHHSGRKSRGWTPDYGTED